MHAMKMYRGHRNKDSHIQDFSFFPPELDPVQSAQQLEYEMGNWGVGV
jgi:hypothetical protein